MPVASPLAFVLSIVVSIFSVALIGFLLSVAVVRYRTAWAMGNLLEYPGWLVCGFLVPLTLFPDWVGLDRLRAAADVGDAGDPGLGRRRVALARHRDVPGARARRTALVGALMSETVLRSARRHATLALT